MSARKEKAARRQTLVRQVTGQTEVVFSLDWAKRLRAKAARSARARARDSWLKGRFPAELARVFSLRGQWYDGI